MTTLTDDYSNILKETQDKLEELKKLKEEYMEVTSKNVMLDATVLNQQRVIEDIGMTLERLTKENGHLKELLKSEWL